MPGDTDEPEVEREDRFDASTNLRWGVVEDSIPEEDVFRHDENRVIITRARGDREYWLHIGSRVGLDSTIMFDSVSWSAGEYGGTLWFKREIGDTTATVGNLDWHAAFPTRELGLVGEWFLEQIDLSEHHAGVECPKCGGEVLHLPMTSACEEPDCDFFGEGHYAPPGSADGQEVL